MTSSHGSLVLSWEDVMRSGHDGVAAYNVVVHEFAHQLDFENGVMDGTPHLRSKEAYERWMGVLQAAAEKVDTLADAGRPTVIDEYGAKDPVEFFAVATEAFFEVPLAFFTYSCNCFAFVLSSPDSHRIKQRVMLGNVEQLKKFTFRQRPSFAPWVRLLIRLCDF